MTARDISASPAVFDSCLADVCALFCNVTPDSPTSRLHRFLQKGSPENAAEVSGEVDKEPLLQALGQTQLVSVRVCDESGYQ